MKLLKLVPDNTNIRFLRWRVPFYAISLLLMAASLTLVFTKGLNLGVDFIGGQMIRTTFTQSAEAPVAELREQVGGVLVDRRGAGVLELGARDAAAQHAHARQPSLARGLDVPHRVAHDDAALRVQAVLVDGGLQQVRLGLAGLDVTRRRDARDRVVGVDGRQHPVEV